MKKIIKKSNIIICFVLLSTAILSMSNLSAQPIAFGIESKTVNDRDTFTVAVNATSDLAGQGIYSFKFTLAYNTTYLEYLGIESTGSVLNTWGMPTANTPSSGRIAIAGAGTTPLSGSGELFFLKFAAKQPNWSLSLSSVAAESFLNEGSPAIAISPGYITVSALPMPSIYPNSGLLFVGDELQMTASGGVQPYTFHSVNPAVASISAGGKVTTVSAGNTKIYVEDANGNRATTSGVIDVRGIRLKVEPTPTTIQENFYLPITIETASNTPVYSGSFELTYPANGIQGIVSDVQQGDFPISVQTNVSNNRTVVSFASATPINGTGILCRVGMKAIGSGTFTVNIQNSKFNENLLSFNTSGTVSSTCEPTVAVTGLLPENGKTDVASAINLSWQSALNAKNYQLFLWKEGETMPSTPFRSSISGTSTNISNLEPAAKYFWKIVSVNECSSVESVTQSFTVVGRSDLMVENVQIPTNLESGSEFTVSFTVKNIGQISTGTAQWRDAVYISTSPNFNDSKTLLTRLYNVTQLGVNESYTQTYKVKMPSEYSGEYYIHVYTDDYSNVTELLENNNTAAGNNTITVAIMPFPDILVKNIHAVENQLIPGDSITIQWQVENIGNTAGLGGWRERVTLVPASGQRVQLSPNPISNTDIEVNETINRSVKFRVPTTLNFSGSAQIEVELLPSTSLVEKSGTQANNKAVSAGTVSAESKLFLNISTNSLPENSTNDVRVVISRSGNFGMELTVSLSSLPAGNITVPATVTIPANAASTPFFIQAIDNNVVDGNRLVTINASASGYTSALGNIEITDNEAAVLQAQLDKTTANEGETLQLTITRNLISADPLTVYISTDKSNQWTFINAATIPANQASVTVPVNVTNDNIPEINSQATLIVSSSGFTTGNVSATIIDDDLPQFTFTLQNDTISEGAGVYATYGIITRQSGEGQYKISLSSSLPNALIIPNSFTLPAGTNELKFNIGAVDNLLVDGFRTVEITAAAFLSSCNCTANTLGNGVAKTSLVIVDNDGPTLSASVNPISIYEGRVNGGVLKVTRNTPATEALDIFITHDQPNEAQIETFATIPAGQSAVEIPITTLNDGVQDGNKLVNITVNATGFYPGISYFYVTDLNKPDYELTGVNVNSTTVLAGGSIQVSGKLHNKGYLLAPIGSSIGFYLTESKFLKETDEAIGTYQSTTSIAIGDSISFMQTIMLPKKTGTFYLYAKANPQSSTNELVYSNNVAEPISITIQPEYTATATVVPKQLLPNNAVTISGTATKIGGQPAVNSPVDVYILNNGTRRIISAMTDGSGNYTAQFVSQNESGHYGVGACYPGEKTQTAMDEFDILGKVRTSKDHIVWLTKKGIPLSGTIQIRNTSNIALHNVKIEALLNPTGFSISSNTIPILEGNATADFNITVTGSSATEVRDYLKIPLIVSSDENTELSLTAFYFCQELQSALITNPASINTTMTKGYSKVFELVVRNNGAGETGKTVVEIPKTPFMRLISGDTIDNIKPNGEAKVILEFTPTEDMPLNTPFSGGLSIKPTHGNSITVPYKIDHVSDFKGSLNIIAKDEFSYNTVEKPNLANAHVTVRHPYSGAMLAEGFTGSDGTFMTGEIPEGHYTVTVEAEKHEGWRGTVLVEAGKTVNKTIFLSYKAITYTWEVIRTEIEDEYKIDLIMEFETNVPKPVVVMEMPDSMPQLVGDEIYSFLVTVTNKGLITARDYEIFFPTSDPEYEFITNFTKSDLLAQQAIQIPVIFKRRVSAGGSQGIPGMMRATTSSGNCRDFVQDVHWFECGPDNQYQQGQKLFTFSGRSCPGGGIPSYGGGGGGSAYPSMGGGTGGGTGGAYSSGGGSMPVMTPLGCKETECLINILKTISDCYPIAKGVKMAAKMPNCLRKIAKGGIKKMKCLKGPLDCVETIIETVESCYEPFMNAVGGSSGMKRYQGAPMQKLMSGTTNSNDDYLLSQFLLLNEAARYNKAYGKLIKLYFGDLELLDRENMEDFHAEVSQITQYDAKFSSEDITRIKTVLASSDIQPSEIDYFTSRWNRTMDAYQSNVFASNEVYHDIIDKDSTEFYSDIYDEVIDFALNNGFYSPADMSVTVIENIYEEMTKKQTAICASVTIQISQRLVMTREAFEGTLTINNGSDAGAMKNISLDIEIKNSKGEIRNDLFQINQKALDILTGIDGNGELGANKKGSVTLLFIPTKNAAPEVPESYSFGGTFSYLDPSTGLTVTNQLFPVTLDVNPSPELHLHYFMQRDILGDDPLTEKIEPVIPAELALMIHNEGFGEARNVRVESAQPEIIENEKGLAIHFELIGSNFNGQPMQLGVTDIDFGNIPPKKTAIGQWWLTSNLLGHFVSYKTNVVHTSSYGNPDLSLVSGATLHELIRSVDAYTHTDNSDDFLINEILDAQDTPDMIYLSNGEKIEVGKATSMSLVSGISPPNYEAEIAVSPMLFGWNYGKMNDPGNGNYLIKSVTRKSDNFVLPGQNVWLTHVTLPDAGDPIYENKLHFLDHFEDAQPENYIIRFAPKPTNTPKIINIYGVPTAVTGTAVTSLDVEFDQDINESTFTYEDLILRLQGGENIIDNTVTITKITPKRFTIDLGNATSGDGYYVLNIINTGISSSDGVYGAEDKQTAWTQFVHAPSVVEFIGLPQNNIGASFDEIQIRFNRAIIPSTLTTNLFTMEKDGVSVTIDSIQITPVDDEKMLFRISGLGSSMLLDGSYTFNIDLTQIKSDENVSGLITQTVGWVVDTTAPAVVSVDRISNGGYDNQHTASVDLKFNEKVIGFGISSIELWKDGAQQPLSQLNINMKDSVTFTLSEFRMLTYHEGEYTLKIKLFTLSDNAGNYGSGIHEVTWVVDRSLPSAITNLRITPDLGYSPNDGITTDGNLKVAMQVNQGNSRVQIYQNISGDKRMIADVENVSVGNLEVPVNMEVYGSSVLEAYCIDQFGNSIVTELPIYIDRQPLNVSSTLTATNALTRQPDSIRIVFSDKLLDEQKIKQALSASFNYNSLNTLSITVTKISDTEFEIGNLRAVLGNITGNYSVSVETSVLQKHNSGKSGELNTTVSWALQVNKAPNANAGNHQTVDAGETVTLNGANSFDADGDAISYQWIAPFGIVLNDYSAANPTFIAPDYSVDLVFTLIVNDGKVNSTGSDVVVSVRPTPTAIQTTLHDLKIYPNPAIDFIKIHGLLEKSEVILIDMTGQIVMKKEILPDELLSINALKKGMYLVKVKDTIVKLIVK